MSDPTGQVMLTHSEQIVYAWIVWLALLILFWRLLR